MKVDQGIGTDLSQVAAQARAIEEGGADGVIAYEIHNDPFLQLAIASQATERVDLMTSIAVAFARNPMTMAQVSHDLQAASKGRMVLGLGSQIRPHITKRFSMEWSKPAADPAAVMPGS